MSASCPLDPVARHAVKMGSDRSFGLVFCGFFLVVAGLPLVHGGAARPWAAGVALLFLGVALVRPALLAPLNRLWFRFGQFLHLLVSPLMLGLMFYVVLTPLALLMRLAGKDPLRLGFQPGEASYWIERRPPGPDAGSMKQQF